MLLFVFEMLLFLFEMLFVAMQEVTRWESTLSSCKKNWEELRGVPLLPLADGSAGTFRKSRVLGGGVPYILATRRQQGLMKQLKGRFVHLKASRRLKAFFDRDEFLQVHFALNSKTTAYLIFFFIMCITLTFFKCMYCTADSGTLSRLPL